MSLLDDGIIAKDELAWRLEQERKEDERAIAWASVKEWKMSTEELNGEGI